MDAVARSPDVINVIVADDHPVVRFGLREKLEQEPDINVVYEVENIEQLIARIEKTHTKLPDVVILDLEMDDSNDMQQGLLLLRAVAPKLRILVYTAHDDDEHILQIARAGMHGYLLKDCPIDHLADAIRITHRGGSVIDPGVASRLIRHLGRQNSGKEAPNAPGKLSNREVEVLSCLAEGSSNRTIAGELFISEATVKFHIHAILSKLQAKNRTEAVMIGIQTGLITALPIQPLLDSPG